MYSVGQKKTLLKEMCDFFNKNVTIGYGVDQNKKKSIFLTHWSKKLILLKNLKFLMARIFTEANSLPMGQKIVIFLF